MDWTSSVGPVVRELAGPVSYVPVMRIVLAAILGGMVGLERERHGRAAGLRTHLLLCVGCALVMLISLHLPDLFAQETSDSIVRADPGRLAGHVLSGLGFLGAGAIITLGRRVSGLTTAACIWVTAAIGLALGCGYVFVAIVAFLVVMFALHILARWERTMAQKERYVQLDLHFGGDGNRMDRVRGLLRERGYELLDYGLDWRPDGTVYNLRLRYTMPDDPERLAMNMADALKKESLTRIACR
jgi:putative Mg2+ transporter-C (MgtC) family protein